MECRFEQIWFDYRPHHHHTPSCQFFRKEYPVPNSNPLIRHITEINTSGRVALCGYFLTGYQSPETFFSCIRSLSCIDVFEFGIPAENSPLDGPVIADTHSRVTDRPGLNSETALSLLGGLQDTVQPRVVMTYAKEGRELDGFIRLCVHNGIHGILVPDLSIEEATRAAYLTSSMNLSFIGFIHDDMDADAVARTVSLCDIVCLKVSPGPTGQKGEFSHACLESMRQRISFIRTCKHNLIIAAGIGIQTADQIRLLARFDFNMVVVGTMLMKKLETGYDSLQEYTRQLHESTFRPRAPSDTESSFTV